MTAYTFFKTYKANKNSLINLKYINKWTTFS